MSDPGGYARRVRARPYGPREVTAGGVTAWFHGPFAVLTFTGADGTAAPPGPIWRYRSPPDGLRNCPVQACRSPRAGRPRSAG